MSILNQAICAINLRNTGTSTCVFDPKLIAGAIELPVDRVLTQAEMDALQATLAAGILAPLKKNRFYPINDFRTPTDGSEDTVVQTMGDGSKVVVRDGNYNWTFQYIEGGLCRSNALRSHNFRKSSWLFYDANNVLIGWRKLDAGGVNYGLAGVPVMFHAKPWKMATGSEIAGYMVMFDFKPEYINDYFGAVKATFPLSSLQGLQNLVLQSVAAPASGVYKIRVSTSCDLENQYDTFGALLASGALWTAVNEATQNAITVSSVASDANIKGYTVTLLNTDPDYTAATAAGLITFSLVDPTALDTADISGFESIPLTIVRGA